MKYKQLETLDYHSEDNYMGEIIFNGQRSYGFQKANAKEGWVETLIRNHDWEFLRDENGKVITIRLYGKVEIFALDKKTGKRIEEKEE
jgi:hypothetical protein